MDTVDRTWSFFCKQQNIKQLLGIQFYLNLVLDPECIYHLCTCCRLGNNRVTCCVVVCHNITASYSIVTQSKYNCHSETENPTNSDPENSCSI